MNQVARFYHRDQKVIIIPCYDEAMRKSSCLTFIIQAEVDVWPQCDMSRFIIMFLLTVIQKKLKLTLLLF